MSITFTDNTSAVLVGYYNDKGTPHVETLTIPATGIYGQHTLTIPNTAGLAQADYVVITSVGAEKSAAVWFDIDAAGTTPTGAFYGNTDYQIEVNVVTGNTAAQNAAAFVLAIAGETGFTDVTITDNLDGTVSFVQDVVGWAGDFVSKDADDSEEGGVLAETIEEGVAGITQGDYIVLENAYGTPIAVWFDVDNDGTPPTGDAFLDAVAYGALEIDVATGDTNIENAANVATALAAEEWAQPIQIVDNEDGTIKLTHVIGGTVAAPDPHNTDDTGLGSITAVVNTTGAATTLMRQDTYEKGTFSIVADTNINSIVFNASAAGGIGWKGMESTTFPYEEIILPVSTSLLDLKSKLDTLASTYSDDITDGSQKTQLVDVSGNVLYPSGEPVRISATLTRPSDNNSYLAGDHVNSSTSSPAAILLPDAAIINGGGGFIMDFKMETDATTFAGATLRFWMFNDIPTGIVNDNAPYVNSFANADKRCACGYFDCTFDPLLGGSDCVIGKYQPNTEYVCATASKNMYILVQTLTAVSTPKSAGVFKFYFNVVKTK